MQQHEMEITNAGLERPEPGKAIAWFSLIGTDHAEERLAFFVEHNDWKIQEKGQRALTALARSCCMNQVNDTAEFLERTIPRECLFEIRKNIGRANAHDALDKYWRPDVPTSGDSDSRYVYVISCTDAPKPLCKIGIASSPERRLRQLSTSSPHALRIEFTRYTNNARGIESTAHSHFADHRKNGEWFSIPASTAISFVNDNIDKAAA